MKFLKGLYFFLFLSSICFSCDEATYAQMFAGSFDNAKFSKSLEILENWEKDQPFHTGKILGMKAAVHLAMGNLEKSKSCMDECLQLLPYENFQHPMFEDVVRLYYQLIENDLESSCLNSSFRLCKDDEHKQPTGVKVKFWFGVGEILAGVLLAPFSGGASIALISMGTSFLVNASCEALNNKDQWEKDLNDRQNINPPDTENNSFIEPIRESIRVIRV